jgi:putative DNA primase/helicase
LYYDPNAVTGIGDISQNPEEFLYANYAQWANNNGQGTMNKQRFSSTLLNLLKAQLGIDAIKRKTNKGRFITCVGIRKPGHNFPLLISHSDDLNQKSDDGVTTSVTAENPCSDGFSPSDDLFTSKTVVKSNNQCDLMPSPKEQNEGDRLSLEPNSLIASVPGSHEVVTVTDSNPEKVVTTPSVTQQIINNWDDLSSLGQLVLSLKLEELHQAVAGFSLDQLQHIKDAANSVWRLGAASLADYNGELVYIWECGQSNNVRIGTKTQPGARVRRAHLRPWLGI